MSMQLARCAEAPDFSVAEAPDFSHPSSIRRAWRTVGLATFPWLLRLRGGAALPVELLFHRKVTMCVRGCGC